MQGFPLDPGWGGGTPRPRVGGRTPIWNRQGCSSEILNLTPKGDHLGVVQAFCDPEEDQSGRGLCRFWPLKETA